MLGSSHWGDPDVDGRIKMDLREVGGGGDWMELAQNGEHL